uniref:Uncharacterized protein n=1 Tax=Sphaerodactylus townsendi TaxID=933632 RepID=A0ACB8EYJ5_9SAUR
MQILLELAEVILSDESPERRKAAGEFNVMSVKNGQPGTRSWGEAGYDFKSGKRSLQKYQGHFHKLPKQDRVHTLSSALLFDAAYAVVSAVQELNRSQEIGVKPLSCGSAQIWQHGTSLMNYLRMVELEGLTGHIEFNSKGQRSNYALKILQYTRNGFRQLLCFTAKNKFPDLSVSEEGPVGSLH